jgi:hypothetical protein
MKQFSLFSDTAETLRDEGITSVTQHNENWMTQALSKLHSHPRNVEVTGEDLKVWLLRNGLPKPKHHNAWGALIRSAATSGMIVLTGRTIKMKLANSHARRNPIWLFRG